MKILDIQELYEFDKGGWSYEGYQIKTDEKDIYLLVSDEQCCCEDFGSICSEDDVKEFIGAEILNMRCVNNADYSDIELTKSHAGDYVDVYECAFIDFDTDRGKLQFAVYNHHNGYYGHDIKIVEEEV